MAQIITLKKVCMKKIGAVATGITIALATCCLQSIDAVGHDYSFSFKNKSSQPIQIEVIQQLNPVTQLTRIGVNEMFTADINIREITKMYIYYCPDALWCKTHKPERMIATFTPKKPIHVVFDGRHLRPQLKRFKNVGYNDITLIK